MAGQAKRRPRERDELRRIPVGVPRLNAFAGEVRHRIREPDLVGQLAAGGGRPQVAEQPLGLVEDPVADEAKAQRLAGRFGDVRAGGRQDRQRAGRFDVQGDRRLIELADRRFRGRDAGHEVPGGGEVGGQFVARGGQRRIGDLRVGRGEGPQGRRQVPDVDQQRRQCGLHVLVIGHPDVEVPGFVASVGDVAEGARGGDEGPGRHDGGRCHEAGATGSLLHGTPLQFEQDPDQPAGVNVTGSEGTIITSPACSGP